MATIQRQLAQERETMMATTQGQPQEVTMRHGGAEVRQRRTSPTTGGGRRFGGWRLALAALVVAMLAALAGQPGVALAATLQVNGTTGTDSPTCGTSANPCRTIGRALGRASFAGDTISIAAGTYYERLTIVKDVTLQGAGAGATIINGTVDGTSGTVVTVNGDITVPIMATIDGVTITGGNAVSGGGVYNNGTLALTNSAVSGNSATNGRGGGVYNYRGTAMLTNSTLGGNSATNGDGGGVYNYGDNYGRGTLTLTTSTLSGNSASYGGGVYNNGSTLELTTSTLSGNRASYGGGVFNDDTATLTTSTLSGNTATFFGGGVYNNGRLTLTTSTLSGNSAGGVNTANRGGGVFNEAAATLTNTILAASGGGNCTGVITSGGHNLASDATCIALIAGGDRQNTDPRLGPLADNGGPTQTHALVPGSPAINTGSCTDQRGVAITTDQRGISRPQGVACDIGAFELVNAAPAARDDAYTATEDTPLTVAARGVLTNDSDAEGTPLTAVLASGPGNGSLALNADGSFTYTPRAGFNGSDSFTYRASDGAATSAAALVTITITPVNDAPVAGDDRYTVAQDTRLTVPAPGVLTNDRDAEGDRLTAVLAGGPGNGSLALNADGSFTYTPRAGFSGDDRFSYRASDGPLASTIATVTITVTAAPPPPPAPLPPSPPPPPPPPPGGNPEVPVTTYTLALTAGAGGSATGGGSYPEGSIATLSATPDAGNIFLGWTVDGAFAGWASPATLTMDGDHTVVAAFAPRPGYPDVTGGTPHGEAIGQLAARGIIRGFQNGTFQPGATTLRAQMAALIARAMGWDAEEHGNAFPDQGAVDANLWRNVNTLAHYGVARGFPDGTYKPVNNVAGAQTISFITRAMVAKGYWQQQPDSGVYPNVPASSGHRQDLATYVHYAGAIPGTTPAAAWAEWDRPSTRAWFAGALWQALNAHFGQDLVP